MMQTQASAEIFRSAWSVYDAIIELNYMAHREIHALVRGALAARAGRGAYRLLDLGCGNARLLADTLREFPPAHYVGVDLSRPALDEATQQLRGLPAVELREQDMLSCVASQADDSVDVIYSSFAMHHLSTAEKTRLVVQIGRVLKPDGQLILVDVVRAEGQSRDSYVREYREMMTRSWADFAPEHIEQVWGHIAQFDYPEPVTSLAAMARAAGLTEPNVLGQFGPHAAMTFALPR